MLIDNDLDNDFSHVTSERQGGNFKSKISAALSKFTTKEVWLGDYDYVRLCTPTLPTMKAQGRRRLPPFYALHADLPVLIALCCGLQHALGMLAGLITSPIILASALNLDQETQSYMISASLIGCGILSLVQMSRIRLYNNYYLGTGLLSVVGPSSATLGTATAVSYYPPQTFTLHTYLSIRSSTHCTLMAHARVQQPQMVQ